VGLHSDFWHVVCKEGLEFAMTTDYRIKTLPGAIPVVTEILFAPKRLKTLRTAMPKEISSVSPEYASNPHTKGTHEYRHH
jgi:hypothetical protein